VVRHAGHPLDDLSHALQRPQIGGEAIGFGTFSQLDLKLGELLSAQLRQPASASGTA